MNQTRKTEDNYMGVIIVKLLTRYSNWKEGTRFETSSENVGESELN